MKTLRLFLTETRRVILSKQFLFAVLVMLAGLIAGSFKELYDTLSHLPENPREFIRAGAQFMYFRIGVESNAAHFVLPIAAALPCSCLFIEDMTSGFVKGYIPRTGRLRYILTRCLTSFIGSAFAVILGIMLFYALLTAVFAPISAPPEEVFPLWESVKGILILLALYASGAALWSSLGLLLSGVTMNRFSAVASPFIVFYLMEILVSQYFPTAFKLQPSLYLMEYGAYEGILTPALVSCVLAVLLLGVFAGVSAERIRRQI